MVSQYNALETITTWMILVRSDLISSDLICVWMLAADWQIAWNKHSLITTTGRNRNRHNKYNHAHLSIFNQPALAIYNACESFIVNLIIQQCYSRESLCILITAYMLVHSTLCSTLLVVNIYCTALHWTVLSFHTHTHTMHCMLQDYSIDVQ